MSGVSDAQAAPSPVVAFGRLLRIARAPTARSDVFVGIAIGHASQWPPDILPWLLIPASLGVYHGAMALNDWADRADDARTRPERPIPSGAIPAGLALGTAALLMLGGLFWAFAAGPRAGLWMGVVALLAVTYDVAGRGPWRGPLLLGLCRAGNLGAGLMSPWLVGATDEAPLGLLALAAAYGLHVVFIGRLGRLEDDEDEGALGRRPSAALRGAALTTLAIPIAAAASLGFDRIAAGTDSAPAAAGQLASAAIAAWHATGLFRALAHGEQDGWTRGGVGAATGLCLRRLPLLPASIAASGVFLGPVATVALVVALGGARVSAALRRLFPLT
ncbi:MAG: UbiA family prenyltransferase [Planctomycetota bacterium]